VPRSGGAQHLGSLKLLVTVLLELSKKSGPALVRKDCRDVGESVVRQLAVLRLPGSSYFKALLGIAVVSRAWAKAMTGLNSWAEVRLLWVSRSLEHLSGTVALAETEGGEAEPVGKDSSAFIVGVKGQQTVEAVLLLTPAAWSAETL